MKMIEDKYYLQYENLVGSQIPLLLETFDISEKNTDFGYKTQASAVYSSNIEGNSIDLNSFMNYKLSPKNLKAHKEIQEIENLVEAYEFAQNNKLSEKNFLKCHKIFSKTLLTLTNRGKYRNEKVGVFGQSGLVYLAIEPEFVTTTMKDFFKYVETLLQKDLSKSETFYYASFIHLKFVHIHPFRDGNGRAARLLEKWFLTEKISNDLWKLSSEKYYKEHQIEYYSNINLGVNFYELNYDNCMPFLTMLPKAINYS